MSAFFRLLTDGTNISFDIRYFVFDGDAISLAMHRDEENEYKEIDLRYLRNNLDFIK